MGSLPVDSSAFASFNSDQRFSNKTGITDASAVNAKRVTLQINQLAINGFESQNSSVANFRNIQYATIPARWHEAVPLDPVRQNGTLDATQWGPRPPQPIDVLHDATRHLYPRMSTFDRQSEFECLNLNVYSPKDVLGKTGRGLPVLVWIHGGAFAYGDGGCEFDGQYLVRRSIEADEPIVVVGLNYRLGVLGFFSSAELRAEARARGEKGYSNLGLHDQRIALQWIQKNIHFFGGDGARLTVAGESAGAISILCHLRGQVPLFQNAFIMSPALISPEPPEEVQKTYDQVVADLGLSEVPVDQQLSALRSIPALELRALIRDKKVMIFDDPEFFCDWTGQCWEEIPQMPSWVQRVVVGQTHDENALFAQKWDAMSREELLTEYEHMSPSASYSQDLLSAYGITKASTKDDLVASCVAITSDAMFAKATYSIATTHLQHPHPYNPKVYLYSFDQVDLISPNPVFRGTAYHSQDNSFLFCHPQVAGPDAPAAFQATTHKYSDAALALVNGREPWEDVSVAKRFMSVDGERSGMKGEEESNRPRWEGLTNTKERLDMFVAAGRSMMFQAMEYAMSLPVDVHRK